MTISDQQRRQTEDRIRAATDRLLRGQLPPGGSCDIKTLARDAGVSRASLYRTYPHLKKEFEDRLARLRDAGHLPDPRAAQIIRLTDDNTRLRQRLAEHQQQLAELTTLKTTAISRLAAQHTEIIQLRAALSGTGNLRALRPPRPTASQTNTMRSAGSALDASRTFAEVTVHAGVLAATADLIELLHDFLDAAGPDLRADLGRFLGNRAAEPGADPAIDAAILVHQLTEATDLLRALTGTHDVTCNTSHQA
jgi:hypothetical protein